MYSLVFWCGGIVWFLWVLLMCSFIGIFFMLFDDFCLCVTNRFVFVLVDKKFFACFCVLCRCAEFISVFLCVVLMLVKSAPVVLLIVNCYVVDVFARSNLADFLFVCCVVGFFYYGVYVIRCVKFKCYILCVFYCFYNISCLLDNCLYGFGGCGLFVLVCGDGVILKLYIIFVGYAYCITLIY